MKSLPKKSKFLVRILSVSTVVLSLAATNASAQDGEAKFKSTCGSCHSIGGGKRVGPDLQGVGERRKEDWLINFIKHPQQMIDSDPDAKTMAAEFLPVVMPDQPLTDDEIKAILGYINGGAAIATAEPEVPARATADATKEEIDFGRQLFTGVASFEEGGASCISCHNVNYEDVVPGGLLAKDLTEAWSRVGEDAGLMGILGSPAFPAMQQAYADHKLSEKEIFALTAFLNKVNSDKANQVATMNPLHYGGIAGIVIVFASIFLVWNKRKRSGVKHDILNRQIRSK